MNLDTLVAAPLAFLMGAILLILGTRELARGAISRSWTKTTGTVISSTVEAVPSVSGRVGYWEPHVAFRYAVSGQEFVGSKYSASDLSVCYTEGGARDIAEKYVCGQIVDVYYREAQPDLAILKPGVRPAVSCIRFIILGVLACLIGWKALTAAPVHARSSAPAHHHAPTAS